MRRACSAAFVAVLLLQSSGSAYGASRDGAQTLSLSIPRALGITIAQDWLASHAAIMALIQTRSQMQNSPPDFHVAKTHAPLDVNVMRAVQRMKPTFTGAGTRLQGPSMLSHPLTPQQSKRLAPPAHVLNVTPRLQTVSSRPSAIRTQSVTIGSTNTTGINPWWTYEEGSLPGIGKYMVNVVTANLIVQSDDIDIPERGVDLAFRRTYNSLSTRNWNASGTSDDGSPTPGMYGNGWTNTFDAHIAQNSSGGISVFDIDGARYDYLPSGGCLTPPTGQYATLCTDGGTGYLWTKKTGTVYYFYGPTLSGGSAAYAGRLNQIWGRNNNNRIIFYYSWLNGDASTSANLTQIQAGHSDGHTLTLNFGAVNGIRLISSVVRPDGAAVSYGYDTLNRLTSVSEISNNNAGTQPMQGYGWHTVADGSQMNWAASPRWTSNGWGTEGSYTVFGFINAGLKQIWQTGIVNFAPSDGTATALQSAYPTGTVTYWSGTYSYLAGETQLSDTDGHAANWFYDGLGRVIQTQEWTGTLWLSAAAGWDANNNLTAATDARANETDYAYDPNGNAIAVGLPSVATSQGTFRPTSLYSYDANNNVTASCDPVETHALGRDWIANPGTSDTLCPSQPGATRYTWYAGDGVEPFGRLTDTYTPLGYHRAYSYNTGAQGGDYGLPSDVTMDSFLEVDGSNIAPHMQFAYDGRGNLSCFSKLQDSNGTHWGRLSYDTLNRQIGVADPDDASLSVPQCTNNAGIPGSHIVTSTSYYPNGQVQSAQTPSEYAVGVSTAFAYDADGDKTSETHHYNCVSGSCAPGTTTNWYDGGDRLVETGLPPDATYDASATPWLTRYIYDLSQGQNLTVGQQSGFRAYGNLYKTAEYFSNAWNDLKGNAYDALDRGVSNFYYAPNYPTHTMYAAQLMYDGSTATRGLLSSSRDALGTTKSFTYDQAGRLAQTTYSDGVTPALSTVYDPDGRSASETSTSYGTEQHVYDQDGRLQTVIEPQPAGYTSPASLTYGYYPDNNRSSVSISSQSLTQSNLETNSYRMDGLVEQTDDRYNGQVYTQRWTSSSAGRQLAMGDTYNANAYADSYDSSGQVSSWSVPSGSLTSVTHDAEGAAKSFFPSALGSTVTELYTTRGELAGQGGVPCNSPWNGVPAPYTYPPMLNKFANGTILPQNCMPYGTQYDPFTGTILAPLQNYGNPRVEMLAETLSFDNDGRLVTGTKKIRHYPNSAYGVQATYTKTYDADNHVINEVLSTPGGPYPTQTSSYGWGPNGHPIELQSSNCTPNCNGADSIHWDGGTPLFVTDSNGSLLEVYFGSSVSATPAAGFTVLDRDWAGIIVGDHYAGSVGGWKGGDSWGVAGADGFNTWFPEVQPVSMPHEDTVVMGSDTFQGARTYNSDAAQWTTPDAYAGEVGDPLSHKAYMWNRNNPLTYQDPSGYSTALIFNSQTQTLRVIGVTGTKDAGIDRTFRAANNVTNPAGNPMTVGGNGHMPDGMWNLGPMESVPQGREISFGKVGFIPLTDPIVGQREGERLLGIHSGRNDKVTSPTYGCIRTTDGAMEFLKDHTPVLLEVNPITSTAHSRVRI